MPKLRCLCGEIINLSTIPCEQEFGLLPDTLLEPLVDKIVQAHKAVDQKDFELTVYLLLTHLHSPGIMQAVECPACYRLAVFARASDNLPLFWFQREKTNFPDKAGSLSEIAEQLQAGKLPKDWQQ